MIKSDSKNCFRKSRVQAVIPNIIITGANLDQSTLDVISMTETKYCPICHKEVEVEYVDKPDADLKICKNCGAAVSIRYKDY